ncbi:5-hydroxyisourate hydrolase [Anticarsia gemmatalis]|uniref:5-hydroxyisourate hydrolase n=1 Tax=Anticarsia gemmatalis TaxID=129554 RepID=UPI003F7740FE
MSRPVLSTHVLDTSSGKPAAGLFVELYKKTDSQSSQWTLWHNTMTTNDGRALFPFTNDSMAAGTYKLLFKVGDYYRMLDKETLYPHVEITFSTKDGQHYHIPLLLSPYGYTTYRGS